MKNKYAILPACIVILAIIFCSCSAIFPQKQVPVTDTETNPTDGYGQQIPVYTDVSSGSIKPEYFVTDENGRVKYTEPGVASYTGIDVSQYQGDIDWYAVKNDGIDFVILRVGCRGYGPSGFLLDDDSFETYYIGAKSAGLSVGVYFFSQAINEIEAVEEAQYVLDKLQGKSIDYPVAFDWERIDYDTARTDEITGEQITKLAVAFCNKISEAGYETLIYFNCSLGYFQYDLSQVNHIPFWLAEYKEAPTFYYDYTVWQYTKTGKVNGINGDVDINISLKDYGGLNSVG